MKQCKRIFLSIVTFFSGQLLMGQIVNGSIRGTVIESFPVSLSDTKTTNLIFPASIISVDKGNVDVLAQKAKGVENILQLKAAIPGLRGTNVTVITSDGEFYSFMINYASEPELINIEVSKGEKSEQHLVKMSGVSLNTDEINNISKQVLKSKRFLHISRKEQMIRLRLNSIYLNNDIMWFSLGIKNYSFLNFKSERFRFFIKDLREVRRTALQEHEIVPLFIKTGIMVPGEKEENYVFGVKPFTIPKNKKLVIQVAEGYGGRIINLNCSYKLLLKARRLD